MEWIKQQWAAQWNDHTNVVPRQAWSDRDAAFYLDSCAGLIKFKPRSQKDLVRFRDIYINRFDSIVLQPDKKKQEAMFFKLYEEIRSSERVKYRANIRTRLKGRAWSFKNLF